MRVSGLYPNATEIALARVLMTSKHRVGPEMGHIGNRDQVGPCLQESKKETMRPRGHWGRGEMEKGAGFARGGLKQKDGA